jgi:hypothetical protein
VGPALRTGIGEVHLPEARREAAERPRTATRSGMCSRVCQSSYSTSPCSSMSCQIARKATPLSGMPFSGDCRQSTDG